MERNPQRRLGLNYGTDEIKAHKYMRDVNWNLIAAKESIPPYKPNPRRNYANFLEYDKELFYYLQEKSL